MQKSSYNITIKSQQGEVLAVKACNRATCTIGRAAKNYITLGGWHIAAVHAQLDQKDDGMYITDRSKGYGTWVDGKQITTYGPLAPGEVFAIGDYRLSVAPDIPGREQAPQPEVVQTVEESKQQPQTEPKPVAAEVDPIYLEEGTLADEKQTEDKFFWHARIHEQLMSAMDLRRVQIEKLNEKELTETVDTLITSIINKIDHELPVDIDREKLARDVLNEAIRLGPLEDLLADDRITEIMVNRYNDIYFESKGRLHKSSIAFSSDAAVRAVIDRIVSPLGRRIDESSPMVDGRLKDGSRVNAIIPPLAIKGPCLTIRKFGKKILASDELVKIDSISEEMMQFLRIAVHNRKNIIVSGGTGSGKTTFLNILSSFIPHSERIITVEDAAELQLLQPHTVSLEARPPNMEGMGMVTIRDLVRNCLRMRPDRIIVGECRGSEALDMLQAMNTGHDGSLTTVHANSPRDLISRLEVMVMMAGMEFPDRAIREQIASAIHLIVQQSRFADGTRKITHITEVTGLESGTVQMQNIFLYNQRGFDEDGTVIGDFVATGRVPEFYEGLRQRGQDLDLSIFRQEES
jgi:pilus assembly protein CpaF